jgi:hypothetical protein
MLAKERQKKNKINLVPYYVKYLLKKTGKITDEDILNHPEIIEIYRNIVLSKRLLDKQFLMLNSILGKNNFKHKYSYISEKDYEILELNSKLLDFKSRKLKKENFLKKEFTYNTKICSSCKKEKFLKDFNNCTKSIDGKYNVCKECSRIASKKSYERNKINKLLKAKTDSQLSKVNYIIRLLKQQGFKEEELIQNPEIILFKQQLLKTHKICKTLQS